MIFPGLSSITFHVKEANGNTLYICNSSVKLLQAPIMTEVEVYGPVVYGEQSMERYTTIANLEAHVSAIIVHHCRIHYSEEGRMQKCECYGAEKIADYPQSLLREMFLF